MKRKKKKIFDAVQMVREIRDARYRESIDPDFDLKEYERIKAKWTKLLEQQEKERSYKIQDTPSMAAEPRKKYGKQK